VSYTHAAPSQADQLHRFERSALTPALRETVRLLESDKFERLTEADIRAIANYRAVELDDEIFFERPFTPGKEAAAALAFARQLGRDVVLRDLERLRATLGCAGSSAEGCPPR
jgi:hypothetical protein